VSEKSLRNQANHDFLAWAEDPRGRKGALPLEQMRKRWRAGHSGVYSFVARQAKWKSQSIWIHRHGSHISLTWNLLFRHRFA
jgi:hypothetical protein